MSGIRALARDLLRRAAKGATGKLLGDIDPDAMAAQIERLYLNAARYEFLRDPDNFDACPGLWYELQDAVGAEFDRLVDAAMKLRGSETDQIERLLSAAANKAGQ